MTPLITLEKVKVLGVSSREAGTAETNDNFDRVVF